MIISPVEYRDIALEMCELLIMLLLLFFYLFYMPMLSVYVENAGIPGLHVSEVYMYFWVHVNT